MTESKLNEDSVSKGFDYNGRVIVVTGGGSGIGAAFCKRLVKRGAKVGVADIRLSEAEAIAEEIGENAIPFYVDTASRESIEELANQSWAKFGEVHGIFNNAGVGGGGNIMPELGQDIFNWIMAVNFKGVWDGCQVFGKRFLAQEGQSLIVNTGSEHSLGVPHLRSAAYTAAKHAVLGMTDVLRREVPEKIQVSIFCPGLTSTSIWKSGEVKQSEFGGPVSVNAAQSVIMEKGMDPIDVADRALDAIGSGAFYAVTHPHNVKMINERNAEQNAAFQSQCSDIKDGDKYDVNLLIAELMRQNRSN